ncbi:MAG: hypothetical protein IT353_21020 [Gemmatimonadaceae bacterium]|nr:hypothetical protein [Gemmatimonadaceae bacterium]
MAIVAVVFGVLTVFAGTRVLLGHSDPSYVVFKPLLIFNTAMGVAYSAAGLVMWRGSRWSLPAACAIVLLNLIALGTIVFVYLSGRKVAVESLGAMAFRSAVWLLLLVGVVWRSDHDVGSRNT